GIRDSSVTGVQTCALPIYRRKKHLDFPGDAFFADFGNANGNLQLIFEAGRCKEFKRGVDAWPANFHLLILGANREADRAEVGMRSEERRVGKEGREWRCGV